MENEEKCKLIWRLWQLLRAKECSLCQKSRVRWLREGDTNSTYFHNVVAGSNRRNCLSKLRIRTQIFDKLIDINEGTTEFFHNHYAQYWYSHPRLLTRGFKKIIDFQKECLEIQFSESKVFETISLCDGTKALSQDGFNINFIKSNLKSLKVDIIAFLHDFHSSSKLMKGTY